MRISDWSSYLCSSDLMRYREALGEDIGAIPEGLYPGAYLKLVAGKLAAEYGERFVGAPESAWLGLFRAEAVSAMMDMIRQDLAKLGKNGRASCWVRVGQYVENPVVAVYLKKKTDNQTTQ